MKKVSKIFMYLNIIKLDKYCDSDEEYYSECLFDYEGDDRLENKKVGDRSIIGKYLNKLKLNPYAMLDIIKNSERNLNIKEVFTQKNKSLQIDQNEILNECIIYSDVLKINTCGSAKNKYEAKLIASLKFLEKYHPGEKWVDLEKKYLKKKK